MNHFPAHPLTHCTFLCPTSQRGEGEEGTSWPDPPWLKPVSCASPHPLVLSLSCWSKGGGRGGEDELTWPAMTQTSFPPVPSPSGPLSVLLVKSSACYNICCEVVTIFLCNNNNATIFINLWQRNKWQFFGFATLLRCHKSYCEHSALVFVCCKLQGHQCAHVGIWTCDLQIHKQGS